MKVHFLEYGHTACMRQGWPKDWPADESWSRSWKEVTCPECLKGKPPWPELYTIERDKEGKEVTITCQICKRTSAHPRDVQERWCGWCHLDLDDVWPPSRVWCIAHPEFFHKAEAC